MRWNLSSWKEIARHLGISVRTAQLWEQERGMPVTRPNGPRGRVYASKAELDAWLARSEPEHPPPARGGNPAPRGRALLGVILVAILALAVDLGLRAGRSTPGPPTSWTVRADSLTVSDAAGREVWTYQPEARLRSAHYDAPLNAPIFEDLDGDGRVEVLFVEAPDSTTTSQTLVCLSDTGDKLWSVPAGRAMATAIEQFEVFVIAQVRVARLGPEATKSIVVVSQDIMYYPTRVAVLSADGKQNAEYWHAGHIGERAEGLALVDVDGDGRSEILAAGISNARRQATLVILDPDTMTGAGPEANPDYRFLGVEDGRGVTRVYFPRSPVSLASLDRFNNAASVVAGPESLTVGVLESLSGEGAGIALNYELTLGLEPRRVVPTDSYPAAFELLPQTPGGESLEAALERLRGQVAVERSS